MTEPVTGGGLKDPVQTKDRPLKRAEGSLPDKLASLPAISEQYIAKQIQRWRRINLDTQATDETPKIVTRDKCILPVKGPFNDIKGQPGFDRLAVILSETTDTIRIYPAVNGDSATLQAALEDIVKKNYHIDARNTIIFAPPFFNIERGEQNKNLMANFLDLKMSPDTKAGVYILTQSTDANKKVGCLLHTQADNTGVPLINLLEPTYVVYPFPRTVLHDGKENVSGGFIISGAAANEVNLPASNIQHLMSVSSHVGNGGRGTIAFPPDITVEDDALNKTNPSLIYRYFGPTAEKADGKIHNIYLKVEDESAAMEAATRGLDKFFDTDEDHLALDGIEYVIVNLPGTDYSIRRPSENVRENWFSYKFTIDEAALLNAIKLTPSRLETLFGESSRVKLVEFLSNMINSNCFKDSELLTDEECNLSEDFVDKLYAYMLETDPRIESGVIKQSQVAKFQLDRPDSSKEVDDLREDLDKSDERLVELKKELGIDPTATMDSMIKNPFEEGVLVGPVETEAELGEVYTDLKTSRFFINVMAVDRINDTVHIGRLYFDAANEEEVNSLKGPKIQELGGEFPGWKFQAENEDAGDVETAIGGPGGIIVPKAAAPVAPAPGAGVARVAAARGALAPVPARGALVPAPARGALVPAPAPGAPRGTPPAPGAGVARVTAARAPVAAATGAPRGTPPGAGVARVAAARAPVAPATGAPRGAPPGAGVARVAAARAPAARAPAAPAPPPVPPRPPV